MKAVKMLTCGSALCAWASSTSSLVWRFVGLWLSLRALLGARCVCELAPMRRPSKLKAAPLFPRFVFVVAALCMGVSKGCTLLTHSYPFILKDCSSLILGNIRVLSCACVSFGMQYRRWTMCHDACCLTHWADKPFTVKCFQDNL